MTFSIVTPSYNQGGFLADCIASVQEQTGVACEHLIMDGGSTDETVAVLKAHPHLQWVSEPDQGQSDAINKGLQRATGDWVMWLNADDYLLPGALAQVELFAASHPEADVIYGDCHHVDEQRRWLRHKREGAFNFNMLLFYGCYIPSTATFLRRRIVADGHLLDRQCRVCMDLDYYLRLTMAGYCFRHLPSALACFRWHGENVSIRQDARGKEEFLQIQLRCLAELRRPFLQRAWLLRWLRQAYRVRRAAARAGRAIGLPV